MLYVTFLCILSYLILTTTLLSEGFAVETEAQKLEDTVRDGPGMQTQILLILLT